MENAFKCQVQKFDCMKDVEESRKQINWWVSESTNGKIKDLLSDLSPDTACVLVSCIYFKSDWEKTFDSEITRDAEFHCAEGKQPSTVKMMETVDVFDYYSCGAKKFKCVKFNFKDYKFKMMIILPDDRFGLNDVIQGLDAKTIEELKDGSRKFECLFCKLKLPKFKIESDVSLEGGLRLLSVAHPFDKEKANFSAMSEAALQPDRRLYVSEVVHKAFVEVNEDGTEAAAQTAYKKRRSKTWSHPTPIPFVVDHPFVFMIYYRTQTLLMGKVCSL